MTSQRGKIGSIRTVNPGAALTAPGAAQRDGGSSCILSLSVQSTVVTASHALMDFANCTMRGGTDMATRCGSPPQRVDKHGPIPSDRPELGPCWLWTGGLNDSGYGQHRSVYKKYKGPVPAGHELDHLCRNRACVNPDHLEPVSRMQNILRGTGHGTETHCPKGHEYTPENTSIRRGRRNCRECTREHDRGRRDAAYWRAYRAKRKALDK